ncbi:hypothetical protein BC826DRAFT_1072947 [Russula brevipes]|nr:hypothetical protein BC826DRAFT_1072947 [Russula brevipes]
MVPNHAASQVCSLSEGAEGASPGKGEGCAAPGEGGRHVAQGKGAGIQPQAKAAREQPQPPQGNVMGIQRQGKSSRPEHCTRDCGRGYTAGLCTIPLMGGGSVIHSEHLRRDLARPSPSEHGREGAIKGVRVAIGFAKVQIG